MEGLNLPLPNMLSKEEAIAMEHLVWYERLLSHEKKQYTGRIVAATGFSKAQLVVITTRVNRYLETAKRQTSLDWRSFVSQETEFEAWYWCLSNQDMRSMYWLRSAMTRGCVLFPNKGLAYNEAVNFMLLNDKYPDLDFLEPLPQLELGRPVRVVTSNVRVLSKYAEKVRVATEAMERES